MDEFSGIAIGLSMIGFVLLVVLLVAILYRPAKRLHVSSNFKADSDEKQDAVLIVELENIGKRKLKLLIPFVRFSYATHAKLYKANPGYISIKFPYTLKVGEKLNFELDLGHFKTVLEKHAFSPTHVKIIINDSAGLDFESHSLTFKI
jgi:hypothetical protein